MTDRRALPRKERQALAREALTQALPLARRAGYGRVTVTISERGAVTVTAEQGEAIEALGALDV